MIKRTPQEIADFLGCYVAMDTDGDWFAYSEKPQIDKTGDCWYTLHSYKDVYLLRPDFIDIPINHNWHTLYEPALKEEGKSLLGKQQDFEFLTNKN